jgi:hypothetical protein
MSKLAHTFLQETFAGEIVRDPETNYKNKLKVESPTFYQHRLNKFQPGDKVTMTITNKKPRRTQQQNRYYWGIYLPIIAQETGEQDLDKLHTLFRGKFLTTGIETVLGQKVRMTRSTTDLSVGEFIEYIMAIENLTGVSAPPPENYQLAPLKNE